MSRIGNIHWARFGEQPDIKRTVTVSLLALERVERNDPAGVIPQGGVKALEGDRMAPGEPE
jgi:hypothetical protein